MRAQRHRPSEAMQTDFTSTTELGLVSAAVSFVLKDLDECHSSNLKINNNATLAMIKECLYLQGGVPDPVL